MKIGITGQSGFIGSNLYNLLGTKPDVERIEFDRLNFGTYDAMVAFVKKCDVIVHCAGVNRMEDEEMIYAINYNLTKFLIDSIEMAETKPTIVFLSSIMEKSETAYGYSKVKCNEMLAEFCNENGMDYIPIIAPNIFGQFCKPYYNSFIATFCHQLTHGQTPQIVKDSMVDLLYVDDLCEIIYQGLVSGLDTRKEIHLCSVQYKVSRVLFFLNEFKIGYIGDNVLPGFNSCFMQSLFNTFISYIEPEAVPLVEHGDERGVFAECLRTDMGGQVSFSTTKAGITRGNHFHTRKFERFVIVKGEATVRLRKVGNGKVKELRMTAPSFVDIPVWHTHNITNTGSEELLCVFYCNELFDPEDPDTYPMEV